MPEIPSLPEDLFNDNQCWVWCSGSYSLADLSRLINLGCTNSAPQTEKHNIAPNLSVIPIIEVQRVSSNLEDINWKDYYIRTLRALTYGNHNSAGE